MVQREILSRFSVPYKVYPIETACSKCLLVHPIERLWKWKISSSKKRGEWISNSVTSINNRMGRIRLCAGNWARRKSNVTKFIEEEIFVLWKFLAEEIKMTHSKWWDIWRWTDEWAQFGGQMRDEGNEWKCQVMTWWIRKCWMKCRMTAEWSTESCRRFNGSSHLGRIEFRSMVIHWKIFNAFFSHRPTYDATFVTLLGIIPRSESY